MDAGWFVSKLSACFEDFPNSERPKSARFDDVIAGVENLSTENNLALLNVAAALLAPGQTYVEVGCYAGASLIGAMRGNEGNDFIAIDNFAWVDRQRLEANLERFGATSAKIIAGDAFEVLESDALADRSIGVLFWDADHSYEGQLRALRAIEPRLARGSLIIVDNADGASVKRAIDDWLREQPRASLVLEIGGRTHGAPWWHDGLQVLGWDDAATTPPPHA
jgi:predicted O-methyltransferase YrrM